MYLELFLSTSFPCSQKQKRGMSMAKNSTFLPAPSADTLGFQITYSYNLHFPTLSLKKNQVKSKPEI